MTFASRREGTRRDKMGNSAGLIRFCILRRFCLVLSPSGFFLGHYLRGPTGPLAEIPLDPNSFVVAPRYRFPKIADRSGRGTWSGPKIARHFHEKRISRFPGGLAGRN